MKEGLESSGQVRGLWFGVWGLGFWDHLRIIQPAIASNYSPTRSLDRNFVQLWRVLQLEAGSHSVFPPRLQ